MVLKYGQPTLLEAETHWTVKAPKADPISSRRATGLPAASGGVNKDRGFVLFKHSSRHGSKAEGAVTLNYRPRNSKVETRHTDVVCHVLLA